jgi:hypothetical protein
MSNNVNKHIIIYGIDLSFNSTGICIYNLERHSDEIRGKNIAFYKIVYNPSDSSSLYNQKIPNVKNLYYHLPKNFDIAKVSDVSSHSDYHQTEATIKGLMIKRVIADIIKIHNDFDAEVIVSIENYIMPTFSGKNQLNTVGGLIQLQGFIRELFIENSLNNSSRLRFCFPTPSHNKYSFSHNGNATKEIMIDTFLQYYNGNSILPDLTKYKIDDLVDAFSLMIYGYKNILFNQDKITNQINLPEYTQYIESKKQKNERVKTNKQLKNKTKQDTIYNKSLSDILNS